MAIRKQALRRAPGRSGPPPVAPSPAFRYPRGSMKIEHPLVLEISRAVRSAGGRALLVGGLVRDALRGIPGPARDFDLEVYGVEGAALRKLLERLGHVKTVGEAFAVYKLGEIDISIPRRDSKTGSGHRGFTVTGDSTMTVEEAARRRDFTVNAILADPLTGHAPRGPKRLFSW